MLFGVFQPRSREQDSAVLAVSFRERPWRARLVRASVVEKARAAMGEMGSDEVLRLRATSAVSRDQSVRRFAQDDDSVGV